MCMRTGFAGAVGHEVAADLAARRLDRDVGLARRHAEALGEQLEVVDQRLHRLVDAGARRRRDLAVLHAVVAERHPLDALAHDLHRLEDLVEPDPVAVEHVAVLRVDRRRSRRRRTRGTAAPCAGPTRSRSSAGSGPVTPSASACSVVITPTPTVRSRQIGFSMSSSSYSATAALDLVADLRASPPPAVGEVGRDAAGADEVVVHPQAGDRLEQAQRLLALAPAVDHHRHRAEVHAVRRLEQQVRRRCG